MITLVYRNLQQSFKLFIWLQLLFAFNGIKVLLIVIVAAYRTIFKLSHALGERKELKSFLLVIYWLLFKQQQKSNRKKEIATVYYSKERCIVTLNLMELYVLDIYKYCCLRVANVCFKLYPTHVESSFKTVDCINICSLAVRFGPAIFYFILWS